MALSAGAKFGSFEVISSLGAGGMGEVYRARDLRLQRGVALKVLPDLVAHDPDRLARFKREAQLLAALNHTNIAAIHGFEEADGVHALVLELVEGPTLADRIAHGPIPLDDALSIARQIAQALEAAHEAGIIHRDLKPANIKVSDQGIVKVLDFGLAKAVDPIGIERANISHSPTFTLAATQVGVILGTAAYMSPEQARGKTADRRADVWAFGCVLYEMLSGRRAFEGEVVSETLAGVLRGEPDWAALPASTPRVIHRLLRRCLEKDPRERLQAIGDARLDLKDASSAQDETASSEAAPRRRSTMERIASLAVPAGLAALLAGGGVWLFKTSTPAEPAGVTRSLLAVLPFDQRSPARPGENRVPIVRRDRTSIALTPDGRTLVIRALGDRTEELFVRRLDTLELTRLAGTEGADSPFISPDGAWVGYRAAGELKRIPIAGGIATTITRIPGTTNPRIYGASWGAGNTIVFATADGLWQVDASGGEPRAVTKPSEGEYRHTLPHVLPGGRAVLFNITSAAFRWDDAKVVVRNLDTGEQKVLFENGADPRYVSTGHIVFLRSGTLMAVPFDAARLDVAGSPVSLIKNVMQAVNMGNTATDSGAGQVAMSSTGTLVYTTGGIAPEAMRVLAWLDRTARKEPLNLPERSYGAPRISPDGQRIAMVVGANDTARVWVHDLTRGGLTPVTSQDSSALWSIWSPDGQRLASSTAGSHIELNSADGTGGAERIHSSRNFSAPSSWSSDGRLLAIVDRETATSNDDVWIIDLSDPKRGRQPFAQSPAGEAFPEFSPDGRWLSYAANPSGRYEVFVEPYPGPGRRMQISTAGGSAPSWRGDSSELYYVQPENNGISMMAVALRPAAAGLSADAPKKLFDGTFGLTGPVRGYDVTRDGRRFLMVESKDPVAQPTNELVMVEHWFEELKRAFR
jgi:eukaryotic-like serine/threonine-protein kinase